MRKLLRGLFIAVGLALLILSYYLYNNFINMPKTVQVEDCNYHVEYSDNSSGTANLVMVKGKIKPYELAIDPKFGVKTAYPVLLRKVEMYQYFMDGDKLMVGWKDIHVNDFKTKKGNEYKNPPFPKDLKETIFRTDLKMNNGNLRISKSFTQKLDLEKYKDKLYIVKNLPSKSMPKGFVDKGNYYLKLTEEVNRVGSLRVYYKVLDYKQLPEVTIIGQQKNGGLHYSNADCRFYEGAVEMSEIEKTYTQDAPHAAAGAFIFGLFFILLGVFKGRV